MWVDNDVPTYLPVTIFKMAVTIPQKLNIVQYHQKLPLKSNYVEFVRYCGGHFEKGDW
jgi:hypothetical protein